MIDNLHPVLIEFKTTHTVTSTYQMRALEGTREEDVFFNLEEYVHQIDALVVSQDITDEELVPGSFRLFQERVL